MSRDVCVERRSYGSVGGYARESIIYPAPEVYICVPLCHYFPLFPATAMGIYLVVVYVLKHFPSNVVNLPVSNCLGNPRLVRKEESHMRGSVTSKSAGELRRIWLC